jgi:hypothetical protein
MTIRSFRYFVLAGLMLILPMSSCGPKYKAHKAQKQQEKRLEKRRKEGEKAISKGKQRHQTIQSKETQKRMKETRRKSEKLRSTRKKPFYKRWYDSLRNR